MLSNLHSLSYLILSTLRKILLSLFQKEGNGGTERLSNLHKVSWCASTSQDVNPHSELMLFGICNHVVLLLLLLFWH